MDLQEILQRRLFIQPRDFIELPLETNFVEGAFLISAEVIRQHRRTDDIELLVMDEDNWKVWIHNLDAIRAGADVSRLSAPATFTSARGLHGNFYLIPPNPGVYHLVLSNIYSLATSKVVDVSVDWLWFEDAGLRIIGRILKKKGWDDYWKLIKDAKTALDEEKSLECCYHSREALISIWVKLSEVISKEKIVLEKGKTPDIRELKRLFVNGGIPEGATALTSQIWSYVSELTKVEKKMAKPPTAEEAALALGVVKSAILYLLRMLPEEHGI